MRQLMLKKVIIIGCPGSGKSTFARRLKEIIELPIYYLDMIWHNSDKTHITKEKFDKKLNEILQKERWIIDGNYMRTLEKRLKLCDTVFLLDYSVDICFKGVESRIGKKREDMPWIEESFDDEFKQWIIDFPLYTLPRIYELIEKYKFDKDIIIFKSRQESNDYLNMIKA